MQNVDRRRLLGAFLLAGVAGATALVAAAPAEAQVVVVAPRHRRRRRWVCWWSRGRRVCGWRWF